MLFTLHIFFPASYVYVLTHTKLPKCVLMETNWRQGNCIARFWIVHDEKCFRSLSSVCCCRCCYGGCCFVAVVNFLPKNLWWVTSLDCLAICNYVEFPTMWGFSPYMVLFSHVWEESMTSFRLNRTVLT